MKRSSRFRKTANLPASVQRQLNAYAISAAAVGVGMLALAPPSEAKIVYTPAHMHLAHGVTKLDLNHDGTADFTFRYGRTAGDYYLLIDHAVKGNRVWGTKQIASALAAGVSVGSKGQFAPGHFRMAECTFPGTTACGSAPWVNVTDRYLGLKFKVKGRNHYGWARLTVTESVGHAISATLTGYAYETVPNKPIITGKTKGPDEIGAKEPDASLTLPIQEPASLGLLAMGAPGLSSWRRNV